MGRVDTAAALAELRQRPVNFRAEEVSRADWRFDTHRTLLAVEPVGAPVPDGPWERACRLVECYEFSPPELVRAVFDPTVPLLGRDMLLEGRFYVLHFYLGVRVTDVLDEQHENGDRAWGWSYATLQGHLERGRLTYQVSKRHDTGAVEFVITAHSQGAPTLGRVERLGWRAFGRRTQLRFYRGCGIRMRRALALSPAPRPVGVGAPAGLVLAPSDARPRLLDRVAIHRLAPG